MNSKRDGVSDASGLRVVARRFNGQQPEEVEVVPLDVSNNGLKIRSSIPLLFEEPVRLEFRCPVADLDIEAEVRWIRPEDEEWLIGLRVPQLLQEKSIQVFSGFGINRRQGHRFPVELDAAMQCSGSVDQLNVTLLDYSKAGIKFSSTECVDVGQRVKLLLSNGVERSMEIMATTRWVIPLESSYLVGCEVCESTLGTFKSFLAGMPTVVVKKRRSPIIYGTCTAIAVCILVAWFMLG